MNKLNVKKACPHHSQDVFEKNAPTEHNGKHKEDKPNVKKTCPITSHAPTQDFW
jgi:hypothetical protein